MSFFSNSSKRNHYKRGHYGSNHYQRKGLLGNLLDKIVSRSHSGGYYSNYGNPYPNAPAQNPHYANATLCSRCNSQIPAGSKFCLNCGEKVNVSLFCINCGESLPPSAKFCLKCGNKISG